MKTVAYVNVQVRETANVGSGPPRYRFVGRATETGRLRRGRRRARGKKNQSRSKPRPRPGRLGQCGRGDKRAEEAAAATMTMTTGGATVTRVTATVMRGDAPTAARPATAACIRYMYDTYYAPAATVYTRCGTIFVRGFFFIIIFFSLQFIIIDYCYYRFSSITVYDTLLYCVNRMKPGRLRTSRFICVHTLDFISFYHCSTIFYDLYLYSQKTSCERFVPYSMSCG